MTQKQLKDLIRQGEGQSIELKDDRIHPRSLAQTLAAFAAADGGVILIGVAVHCSTTSWRKLRIPM